MRYETTTDDRVFDSSDINDSYHLTVFSNCNFPNTVINLTQFTTCAFEDCTFDKANITHTTFYNCKFRRCVFTSSGIVATDLSLSLFEECIFKKTKFIHCIFDSGSFTYCTVDNKTIFTPSFNILSAYWGHLSEELTTELMKWNVTNHPNPKQFEKWSKEDAPCPWSSCDAVRPARFLPKKELFKLGPPLPIYELVQMLIREKFIIEED